MRRIIFKSPFRSFFHFYLKYKCYFFLLLVLLLLLIIVKSGVLGLAITTSQSLIADPLAVAPEGSFFFLPPFRSTAIEDSQSSTPTSFLPVYENVAFSASSTSFAPPFSFSQQASLDLNEASTLLDNSFSSQSPGKATICSLFR